MSTSVPSTRSPPMVSAGDLKIAMWTLSTISTLFLCSRFIVRIRSKGRLMFKDYSLVLALPMLFVALGLLHNIVDALYQLEGSVLDPTHQTEFRASGDPQRLTTVIELLWIVIYCVKLCFLTQFKLYRPPYAYVNANLTKFYWATTMICTGALVWTILVPVILCPNPVISFPVFLIRLAKLPRPQALIDGGFKTLSLFAMIVAAMRLSYQYDTETKRINYIAVIFWLVIEANVALIMASITSYRSLLVDHLKKTGRINKVRLSHELESNHSRQAPRWRALTRAEMPRPMPSLSLHSNAV
ncbi:unnamed protein product [Periconia digitata]|uniref:Uncharacterized protein n=1 Tax=Periconia digitata TaxID=1303443 RepID=A0A9W4XGG9_9PLEO|nr:unnamed protein product [Periconia digitata]